ncbi:MLP-like protein 423 [Diospyros lotus]|uniref:MLP-like protein 423 n=1 Tax=Diospyros lotus TaxID=55363 RepID=UPI002254691B|nr:MLP-like protein 423 [Diospyros lotus]
MAQICKLESQTEIKSSPDRLFDIYKNKINLMPKICPSKIQSIQVLEGDGRSEGSVRLWTYILGGTPVIAKDKIYAMDEENKLITFDLIGGEITKYYNNFKATLQATPNLAKWTLGYEKANEDIPTPHSNIDFLKSITREVDDYLLKVQKHDI